MQSSPEPLAPLVRKLLNTHPLTEEDRAAVLSLPNIMRKLENGQYIVREGDVPTHSCLVVEGFAVRHKIMGNGARQIVNLHVGGDMVDLQNSLLRIADHNVQALTTMTAAFIPERPFSIWPSPGRRSERRCGSKP